MNEKINMKTNFILNLFFQVLNLVVPLITTPYVSRVLEADNIGLYSYALSVVSYFGIFGSLGFSIYGQLAIAKVRDDIKTRSSIFWEINFCRASCFIFSILLYLMIALKSNQYCKMYLVLSLYLLTQLLDISWYYQALEQFKETVTRNAIVKLIGLVLIYIFVKQKSDIYICLYTSRIKFHRNYDTLVSSEKICRFFGYE